MKFGSVTLNLLNIPTKLCRVLASIAIGGLVWFRVAANGQDSSMNPETGEIRIVAIQGSVELMPAGAKTWVLTQTNQVLYPGDQLRTTDNSRVTVLWSDKSVVPLGPLTQIEILQPDKSGSLPGMNFIKGVLSFFHRDKPGTIRVLTHGANASIEGTEFVIRSSDVNGSEQETLSVIDGKVLFGNSQGSVLLTNDQQAVAEQGRAPVRAPGFIANNLLQWCFYYPAVLDPADLSLTPNEQRSLRPSLDAYRAGNLLAALARYAQPEGPVSDSQRVYHAALLLSVGEVEQTESELNELSAADRSNHIARLADALRTLIAAVKRQPIPSRLEPVLPTELLADSYYEQSLAKGDESLNVALGRARKAAALSPQFGFACERVAELEFSFGRIRECQAALDKSLDLSPQNAQAQALKGFLLASQNRISDATAWFDRAIATDGALGNAWLGRGLCRIRRNDFPDGLHDLLVAAGTEPQRSLLRSYLAKGFSNAGDDALASREIAIALRLDPNDPTGWLYAALIKQQENRINGAVGDMEKSQSLNDNRQLFRSKMLLDQDNAVRSANLAQIYQDAGMNQVSVDEAAKAVDYDYANYSAHLFLAESDDALRDPTRFDLRYETAWFNELLLANLYAPVGASTLSQNISEQEYSPLLTREGVGLNSDSQYRSDGQFHEIASQYGDFGRTSYSLDLDYQHNDGIRPNNDLSDIEWYSHIKQQVGPNDAVMLFTEYQNFDTGDNFQYNNETNALLHYRENENQTPTLAVGWRHQWNPGIQTLMLAGRLVSDQNVADNGEGGSYALGPTNTSGQSYYAGQPADLSRLIYSDQFTIYTAELNQLIQSDKHTTILGGRVQYGDFTTYNDLTYYFTPALIPAVDTTQKERFRRLSLYAYHSWELLPGFLLTVGLTADEMTYPDNFRFYPITPGETSRRQLSPKVAVTWTPIPEITMRAAYAETLGGASFDESYTLEPTEIAGFNQAFRSIISESMVGPLAGPKYGILGGAADLKFKSRTYVTLQGQLLTCDVNEDIGVLYPANLLTGAPPYNPGSAPERLRYQEPSASATLNQLIG
ncbi:MAG TPA: TonB-dependent receptor, partial [Verrucomicrobiae bacterium]